MYNVRFVLMKVNTFLYNNSGLFFTMYGFIANICLNNTRTSN